MSRKMSALALEVASQLFLEGDLSLVQRLLWFNNDTDEVEMVKYLNSQFYFCKPNTIQELIATFNRIYRNNINECVKLFAGLGSMGWVQYFLDQEIKSRRAKDSNLLPDLSSINWGMAYAAKNGHMEIVQLMLSKGASSINLGITFATQGGQIEIVRLMLDLGANDLNGMMLCAAENGHIEIVQLMLDRGANDYNMALLHAARFGHINIVKLMVTRGANNLNQAVQYAALRMDHEFIRLIREYQAAHNQKYTWS